MRKLVCTAMAVGCIVAGAAATSTGTEAAARVKIVKVFFDSPGSPDSKTSNASLNGEYVAVKNMTTATINLKGWKVADAQAHVYTFPSFNLAAGKTVAVHTGTGTANSANLYWKSENFVWNNDTDTATLRNPAGTVIHRCKYPNSAGGVKITGTTATGKYATCP